MDIHNFIQSLEYLKEYDFLCLSQDDYQDYLHQMNRINIDLRGLKLSLVDEALFEAIYTFDKLAMLRHPIDFHRQFYQGIHTIDALYHNYEDLHDFHGDKQKRDIFFAQFQYFINKYLLTYFHKTAVDKHKGMSLTLKTRNSITFYLAHKKQVEAEIKRLNYTLYTSLNKLSN